MCCRSTLALNCGTAFFSGMGEPNRRRVRVVPKNRGNLLRTQKMRSETVPHPIYKRAERLNAKYI